MVDPPVSMYIMSLIWVFRLGLVRLVADLHTPDIVPALLGSLDT